MRKGLLITLLLIIVLFFSINVLSEDTISNKKAVQDLDFLVNRLKEVHPNLYFELDKSKADNMVNDIKDKLYKKERWTAIEIYRLFAPFVASFKDGHTILSFNSELINLDQNKQRLLPLDIRIINKEVLIKKSYTVQDIEKGTKVLAVNGIEINKILSEIKKMISSENDSLAYARIEKAFSIYLWAVYNFEGSYQLKLKDKKGKGYSLEVKGITKEIYDIQRSKKQRENWKLDFPIKNTAYLTINTFNGSLKEEFKVEIDKYFEEINKRKINNLFIDLSENGGGNTDLAKYLVDYIYDKPYSLFNQVTMKYSNYAFKDRSNIFIKIYYQLKMNEDNLIFFKSNKIQPKDNELRFKGNIYLITADYTFSTATDFAAIIKDYGIGTIIGEETGGLASSYGDMISGRLPNSNLPFGISYKYFLRPAGFDNKRGVLPDIEIKINKLKFWYDKDQYQRMIINKTLN
ncbi:MAG: hypothetical protein K9K32_02490 [Halanaerobiales bacterium]|nr:hypothetical protein [Halanaerobiales bacterium]